MLSTAFAMTDVPPQPSTAAPTVSLEWWPAKRREEALAAWFALEERLGELPIACSADWTDVWL